LGDLQYPGSLSQYRWAAAKHGLHQRKLRQRRYEPVGKAGMANAKALIQVGFFNIGKLLSKYGYSYFIHWLSSY
jgi:hypothetical protein